MVTILQLTPVNTAILFSGMLVNRIFVFPV